MIKHSSCAKFYTLPLRLFCQQMRRNRNLSHIQMTKIGSHKYVSSNFLPKLHHYISLDFVMDSSQSLKSPSGNSSWMNGQHDQISNLQDMLWKQWVFVQIMSIMESIVESMLKLFESLNSFTFNKKNNKMGIFMVEEVCTLRIKPNNIP